MYLQSLQELLRVWYHESQRVFADRLVNDEDRSWFSSLLTEKMLTDFGASYQDVVTSDPLLYADFMAGGGPDERHYVEVTDHDKVRGYHLFLIYIIIVLVVFSLFFTYYFLFTVYISALVANKDIYNNRTVCLCHEREAPRL